MGAALALAIGVEDTLGRDLFGGLAPGGNVEGSEPGETVRIGQAQVWGGRNVPSQMPGPASRLLSTNIVNLLTLMTATAEDEPARFEPDWDDEVVAGSCMVHDGDVRHQPTRELLEEEA